MNDARIPLGEFTQIMMRLQKAFGREINENLAAEHYEIFGKMSADHYAAIVEWAVLNLDTTFPTIARLRKEALRRGWLSEGLPSSSAGRRFQREEDNFVEFVCPECEGTFLIKPADLAAEARVGRLFECVNARHWGCKQTISASELLERWDRRRKPETIRAA